MRKIVLRMSGYLHAILVLMAVLTPVYGAGLLADRQVLYGIYWLGLGIAAPVVVSGIAIHKCKNVVVYLLLGFGASAGMLLGVWAVGRHFLTSTTLYFLLAVLLAEACSVVLDHLRVRISLNRARKDGSVHDTKWIPPRSIFEGPAAGGFVVFALVYLMGLLIASKVICNVTLVESILYAFLYLAYHYVVVTEGYFRLQHNVKNIPARRVYGITGGCMAILAVLLVGVAVVSLLLIPQRKYFDVTKLKLGGGEFSMEDMMEMAPSRMGGMEELLGEDYAKTRPMPEWLEAVFEGLAVILLLALCLLAARGIWRYLKIFRETEEENGDLVEELVEMDEMEALPVTPREREARSERERIRRLYRKTIRKYRKERPKESETPTEIERAAGIAELEEICALHMRYEEVRYGEEEQ